MKLEERILIEIRLKEGKSISKISKEIKKCLNYTMWNVK